MAYEPSTKMRASKKDIQRHMTTTKENELVSCDRLIRGIHKIKAASCDRPDQSPCDRLIRVRPPL
jgi:hypothetical protein